MPHRVSNFLRNSSGNIAQIKRAATSRSRNSSRNNSPYTSDGEEHSHSTSNTVLAVKGEHLHDMKKHHRISLPFGKSHKDQTAAVAIEWSVESPPIVYHGNTEDSTGALVSGQMFLDVRDEEVEIGGFTAALRLHTVQKRPFQGHCTECQNQYQELKSWQFLPHPTILRKGRYGYPFSILLDGKLPASMDTPVVGISYEFRADAYVNRTPNAQNPECSAVHFERTLDVKRSLPEQDLPHHSVRVFPPTNIKASAHYSSVIHPTGANKVSLRLDGLITHNEKTKTMDFWRLKKVTWRLEETIKSTAPACTRHVVAATTSTTPGATPEPEKRSLPRSEVRLLGEKHLHEGWKSDFSGADGNVDMEFDYSPNQYKAHTRELKYACDTKTQQGIEVTHSLLIELVVSREYAPEGKPQLATQTGTGRILRMHYAVTMTDYAGMGVSWDNEAPPVYQDVPPSPPAYPMAESPITQYTELESPSVEYESLDARRLSNEGSQSDDTSLRRPSA